jgi:hypothetical protein
LCSPLLNNDLSLAAIPAAILPRPPASVAAPDGLTEEGETDEEVDPEEEIEAAEAAEGVPGEAAPVVSSGAPWTVAIFPVPVGMKTFAFGGRQMS